MADATTNNLPESSVKSLEADPLLEYLIHLVETIEPENLDAAPETGITLIVGGMLISGVIIRRREYFKAFWGGIFSSILYENEEDDPSETVRDESNKDTPIRYQFIHLKEARILDPSGHQVPAEGEGALLRLRTNTVDGFMKETLALETRKN